MGLLCIIILILITAVFTSGSASLLYAISHIHPLFWVVLIFIYFFLSIIFPIDKVIGRIYPFIGAYFVIITMIVFIAILISSDYIIPEITTQNLYFSNHLIFPFICVTIACGAISGFHAT